jgi:hypothetical protein
MSMLLALQRLFPLATAHSVVHTHTHTQQLAHHSLTHTLTHSLTHTLTHTHTHTLTRTLTHTHSLTHSQFLRVPVLLRSLLTRVLPQLTRKSAASRATATHYATRELELLLD